MTRAQMWRFRSDAKKMGSSARPYGLRRSIVFPPQKYHSQSIGSALRASSFVSFGTFARRHNPNVGSARGTRLSTVANASGANFSPPQRPPCGLRHAAFDSDHAECTEKVNAVQNRKLTTKSLPEDNELKKRIRNEGILKFK